MVATEEITDAQRGMHKELDHSIKELASTFKKSEEMKENLETFEQQRGEPGQKQKYQGFVSKSLGEIFMTADIIESLRL